MQHSSASQAHPGTPENAQAKPAKVVWDDPFLIDSLLTEEVRMIWDTAHAYCQDKLKPRAIEGNRSAALSDHLLGVKVNAWVGALERPEFLRQSALLAENWGRAGLETALVADPDKHHFNVIDGIGDPTHPLCQEIAGD